MDFNKRKRKLCKFSQSIGSVIVDLDNGGMEERDEVQIAIRKERLRTR